MSSIVATYAYAAPAVPAIRGWGMLCSSSSILLGRSPMWHALYPHDTEVDGGDGGAEP